MMHTNNPQNHARHQVGLTVALIGKKAGKKIRPGDRVQVRNPNGTVSQEFTFTG